MKLKIESNKIWVSTKPIDFRCGIDRLCFTIVEVLKRKPHEGLYVFYNRRRDKIKLLSTHRNGFLLIYKRLEKGKFPFEFSYRSKKVEINSRKLSWLIAGLNWRSMSEWEELTFDDYF